MDFILLIQRKVSQKNNYMLNLESLDKLISQNCIDILLLESQSILLSYISHLKKKLVKQKKQ
ncbi:unnamed protein product [Paramecium primaurelia]|uniref:Uncharacterized protein n=2 Tax=Paramecium TaxID=5884 RepID=A0A8S1W932_9CILI|nr:unnamed protein product [Paramecium primaurelia]CAD8185901.1 unnamed protein product [Paramecium pentaurelia]